MLCDVDNCKFEIMNYTYDFFGLQQMGVLQTTDKDIDDLSYQFTICGNLTQVCDVMPDAGIGSAQQFRDGSCMTWLGVWDSDGQEIDFINYSNPEQGIQISWHEGYGEGNLCYQHHYMQTRYLFYCNKNTTYRALYATVDEHNACLYEIAIETHLACLGWTPVPSQAPTTSVDNDKKR